MGWWRWSSSLANRDQNVSRRREVTLYPPAPSTLVAKCFSHHTSERMTPPK
jgi:hypothetical protein